MTSNPSNPNEEFVPLKPPTTDSPDKDILMASAALLVHSLVALGYDTRQVAKISILMIGSAIVGMDRLERENSPQRPIGCNSDSLKYLLAMLGERTKQDFSEITGMPHDPIQSTEVLVEGHASRSIPQ